MPFSLLATSPDTDSTELFFDQFDPSLGTLTAVIFTLSDSTTEATISIQASVPGASGVIAAATGSTNFNITGPTGTLFAGNGSASAACFTTTADNCIADTDSATEPTFPPNSILLASGVDVTPFIGLGQFAVTAAATAGDPVFSLCQDLFTGAQGTCGGSTTAAWNADIDVAYEFVAADPGPNDIPAPVAVGLFGLALAGLGIARRRR